MCQLRTWHRECGQMPWDVTTMVGMKILTVCLGNICRSPAAESVLVQRLSQAGIEAEVASAGTADYHIGKDAHNLTRKVGHERGYAFTSVADQVTPEHIDNVDLVLAMDQSNLENLLAITENAQQRAKIIRFGAFGSDVDQDGIADVPDPYGFGEEVFVDMYNQIEDAAQGLVTAIQDDSLDSIRQRYGNQ